MHSRNREYPLRVKWITIAFCFVGMFLALFAIGVLAPSKQECPSVVHVETEKVSFVANTEPAPQVDPNQPETSSNGFLQPDDINVFMWLMSESDTEHHRNGVIIPGGIRMALPRTIDRVEIVDLLNYEKMKRGAEIGVEKGQYSFHILKNWKYCESFLMVDPWIQQENYHDLANIGGDEQQKKFESVVAASTEYPCAKIFRGFSEDAVKEVDDLSLDFVYIDARHDYKSVIEDLVYWWPKVRVGGVVVGHDYTDQYGLGNDVQHWNIMNDGTVQKDGRAVKGAVDDFAYMSDCQVLLLSTNDPPFKSWWFRKWNNRVITIDNFAHHLEGIPNTAENVKWDRGYKSINERPSISDWRFMDDEVEKMGF